MSQSSNGNRPLRIVHVTPAYAPLVGGCERLLQSVSDRLVERGHEVTVLTFDCATMLDFHSHKGAGLPRDERVNGVRVIRVNPVGNRLNRLHQWWLKQPGGWRTSTWVMGDDLWPLDLPSGIGFVRPLARVKADVVTSVNWYFGASFWVARPRHLRRTPRVAIPVLHIEREWAHNPMLPRMFSDCDGVIVCTDAERDFIEARGGNNIAVAGCGVDASRFERRDGAAIRARYNIGDRTVVGFVGRQDPLTGVPTLIEAMHTVWKHAPDTVLFMAGQSAHRDQPVKDALAALSPSNRAKVILHDDFADAELPSIMDACDLLALPSVEESFGLVMIEAWVCKKPVIGADIASTRCIIDIGVDGLTVRPFDAADLAAKILELVTDREKRERFGERGREKVLSRYTWDRVTDAWEASFRKAAAASSENG
jgi:glycosyltransferase involved in cell wall biosynthesis